MDNILDKYGIPSWIFDNSKPVLGENIITHETCIFISFKDAARALAYEGATESAISSLRYRIGKAAQVGKEYIGYKWSLIDKQSYISKLLSSLE